MAKCTNFQFYIDCISKLRSDNFVIFLFFYFIYKIMPLQYFRILRKYFVYNAYFFLAEPSNRYSKIEKSKIGCHKTDNTINRMSQNVIRCKGERRPADDRVRVSDAPRYVVHTRRTNR